MWRRALESNKKPCGSTALAKRGRPSLRCSPLEGSCGIEPLKLGQSQPSLHLTQSLSMAGGGGIEPPTKRLTTARSASELPTRIGGCWIESNFSFLRTAGLQPACGIPPLSTSVVARTRIARASPGYEPGILLLNYLAVFGAASWFRSKL